MWIVFDYGEVISTRTAALPTLASMLGVPAERFDEVYWAARDAYDRGQSDLDYWRSIGDALGTPVSPSPALSTATLPPVALMKTTINSASNS